METASSCYVYRCTDIVVIETKYCGSVERKNPQTFAPSPRQFFFGQKNESQMITQSFWYDTWILYEVESYEEEK